MRCENCGTDNAEGASRCPGCGAPLPSPSDFGSSMGGDSGWRPPTTEEEYLDMWWYRRFGTPPGAFGTLLLAFVLVAAGVLVLLLIVLAWLILRSPPHQWQNYLVGGASLASAIAIVAGLVIAVIRLRSRESSSDREVQVILSGEPPGKKQ